MNFHKRNRELNYAYKEKNHQLSISDKFLIAKYGNSVNNIDYLIIQDIIVTQGIKL
jgi:hypothetical protein